QITSVITMKFSGCIFFSLLLFQLKFAFGKQAKKHKHALITILVDGFRNDYLELARKNGIRLRDLKGFKHILKNGVETDYLQPVYPTNSIPNHYSLMTGLYSESHGMVENWMFDPIYGTTFLLAANPESKEPYWWEGGDPLWITAQRQGKRSALYYWFGCDVEIHGLRPEHCTPNTVPSHEEMKDSIIEAVEQIKDGVDHAGIYVETLDITGHKYGLNHTKIIEGIQQVDELLVLLFKQLKEHKLHKTTDIMIFSDHGFTQVYPHGDNKKVVSIELDNDLIFLMVPGFMTSVLPKMEHAMEVYQILQEARNKQGHFDIYWKEEIPERWHYQNHYRIAPLIVQAHSGWIIEWLNQLQLQGNARDYLGTHGYVPESVEMRGMFYAEGPSFKRRFKHGPVSAVDLYQLMCHVLELQPSPHN
ncbi:unnamed protein product, partial [Owenia fusiformis]